MNLNPKTTYCILCVQYYLYLSCLPYCLEMSYMYVFSIAFFMINGIIQAQRLVNQVHYLDQYQ